MLHLVISLIAPPVISSIILAYTLYALGFNRWPFKNDASSESPK